MNTSDSDRNPVEELAEEYLARLRAGEAVAISEYTDRFPQWSEQIRDLFPTLAAIERIKPDPEDLDPQERSENKPASALQQIGDYRILREIGRGGMGVVYEAEQSSLGRHVALKVLPDYATLDQSRLARFIREAKAAARLHHSNIVPVFGVGEHNGLHYYVMQYIAGSGLNDVLVELRVLRQNEVNRETQLSEDSPSNVSRVAHSLIFDTSSGEKATNSSDLHPALSSDTVVNLPGQTDDSGSATSRYWQSVARIGIQVCRAIEYSHGQGIVHRDIKPSNLLLDPTGDVWVTDFGLAKISDGDDITQTGDVIGTMRYMAPERFRGESAEPGDIYSIGLTLYELITCRPAFEQNDRAQLIQEITTTSPVKPSVIEPLVPRDLETIVLKAIQPGPADRYRSAAALGDDLLSFLEGRPISARRNSALERAWMWCRRNQMVASIGVITILILLASTFGAVAAALRINQERQRAEANFFAAEKARTKALENWKLAEEQRKRANSNLNRTRRAIDDFYNKVSDDLQLKSSAMLPLRQELLTLALGYYEDLTKAGYSGTHADMDLAAAHYRIGVAAAEFGDTSKAVTALQKSIAIAEPLVNENPKVAEYAHHLASCYATIGKVLIAQNEHEKGNNSFDKAIQLYEQLVANHPENRTVIAGLTQAVFDLAMAHRERRALHAASDLFHRALTLQQQLLAKYSAEPGTQRLLALTNFNLGVLSGTSGLLDEGIQYLESAVELQEGLVETHPGVMDFKTQLGISYGQLGLFQKRVRRYQQAAGSYQKSIRLHEQIAKTDPSTRVQFAIATNLGNLGNIKAILRDSAAAMEHYQSAVQIYTALAAANPDLAAYQNSLADAYYAMSACMFTAADYREALRWIEQCIPVRRQLSEKHPLVTRYQRRLATDHALAGRIQINSGEPAPAKEAFEQCVQIWDDIGQQGPYTLKDQEELGEALHHLARTLKSLELYEQSLRFYDQAIERFEPLRDQPFASRARNLLMGSYWSKALVFEELDRYEDAQQSWGHAAQLGDSQRTFLKLREARTHAFLDKPDDALEATHKIVESTQLDAHSVYQAARNFALVAGTATNRTANQPAERSLELLRKAKSAGFFGSPKAVSDFKSETDFEAISNRDDFIQFRDSLK